MAMNSFQKTYYKSVCTFIPNVFFVLTLWTSFDVFLTSLIMLMLFYLLMTLYYFKVEDANINDQIRVKVEELIIFNQKARHFFEGYFMASLFSLVLLSLAITSDDLPIYLPVPRNAPPSSLVIYCSFIVFLFCVGLQVLSSVFFRVFVPSVLSYKLGWLLGLLLEIEACFFFTQRWLPLLIVAALLAVKHYLFWKEEFPAACMKKIGFSFGMLTLVCTLVIINTKFSIVKFHPDNYWKF